MNFDYNSEEFEKTLMYNEFSNENGGEGILKIQASAASRAIPLKNVSIVVSKIIDGNKIVFFTGLTDESGIIESIILPAQKSFGEINSSKDIVYTTYDVSAKYLDYDKKFNVSIFDGIKVIQPVRIPINDLIEGGLNE